MSFLPLCVWGSHGRHASSGFWDPPHPPSLHPLPLAVSGHMFLPSLFCMYVHLYLFGGGVGGGGGGHCWSTPRYIPRSYQGASTTTKGGGGGRERKKSDVLEIFSEFTQYGLAIPKIGYASYQRWSKKNNKQTKQKHTNSANFLAVPQ